LHVGESSGLAKKSQFKWPPKCTKGPRNKTDDHAHPKNKRKDTEGWRKVFLRNLACSAGNPEVGEFKYWKTSNFCALRWNGAGFFWLEIGGVFKKGHGLENSIAFFMVSNGMAP
jgi:hypothetical protein